VGNGSLGYSKFICLGKEIHAKGILGEFYDFNLGVKGSHWEVLVVKILLSKKFKKLVGLKGVEKSKLCLQWCQVKHQ